MIEPKIFYRQLDEVLAQIAKEKTDENYFRSILVALEEKFAPTLKITCGHVYEKHGEDFILIHTLDKNIKPTITENIAEDTDAVQAVLRHKTFIYNDPALLEDFELLDPKEKTVLAAISVYSPEKNWLLVFELDEGWVREEISLFMNAVRTALNYRLFSQTIWTELERSVQIQKSLLPKESPKIEEFDIYGYSQPAEMVGGDFYEYFEFHDDAIFGTAIGDASGHGLPAALLVRDVVIGLRMGLEEQMRTIHMLKKLNHVIQKSTYSTNFVSLFIGEIEKSGHMFYINAGHPPPFLIEGDKIHDLEATGITLGFLPEIQLTRSYCHIDYGNVLVLYTDGIIERQNKKEEQFGIARLKKLVLANQEKPAKEIVELIVENVFDFGSKISWEDDATIVVIKRDPQK